MTPEEVRALVAERFARVTYEEKRDQWAAIETRPRWEELTDDERAPWLAQERPYVAALGDMLPTRMDERRIAEQKTCDGRVHRPASIRRRYFTDWHEVTE